jgi:hypothetical protein
VPARVEARLQLRLGGQQAADREAPGGDLVGENAGQRRRTPSRRESD